MKTILTEPHAVIGHTMQSKSALMSAALMSALRQSDPSKGEVVVINNGEVAVVNSEIDPKFKGLLQAMVEVEGPAPENSFDWDKDIPRIMREQDKKQLSENTERDRGIEIRKQKTELEYGKFIEDDGYLVRRLKKPNTGIEIGSYKKKPKKQKQRKY